MKTPGSEIKNAIFAIMRRHSLPPEVRGRLALKRAQWRYEDRERAKKWDRLPRANRSRFYAPAVRKRPEDYKPPPWANEDNS